MQLGNVINVIIYNTWRFSVIVNLSSIVRVWFNMVIQILEWNVLLKYIYMCITFMTQLHIVLLDTLVYRL